MNARHLIMFGFAPFALTACSQYEPAAAPAVSPAAQVIGPAQSCISLAQIRSTRIRDDFTIDFMGAGDNVWRNTLPNRCPGLKSADAFSYETSLTQLCGTDVIRVLERMGGTPRPGTACGLGQFVPVKLER